MRKMKDFSYAEELLSLLFMWCFVAIIGIWFANIKKPDALDVDKFILLNEGVFLYHLCISSICFCASSVFNSTKNSLLYGGGITLLSFVVSLIVKLSQDLDFMKYFTLNTLFKIQEILEESVYLQDFWILIIISIILYIFGIVWFDKKD